MECNCKAVNVVLGLVVLVFTFWPVKWVVVVAALAVVIHALMCGNCAECKTEEKPAAKSVAAKKKK